MITTVDNPFDPAKDWDKWFDYDLYHHHNQTLSLLDRFARTGKSMPEEEYNAEIERAIDEIIEVVPEKIYKKLVYNE